MSYRSRREFLADVGRGALVASVGAGVAAELGMAPAFAEEVRESLTFGSLEPLVCLMQETPADRVLPLLVDRLRSGTELRTLVAAGALANARTFGGEDYVGFHTMMAMVPAYKMALESSAEARALPVLKVLYRNTARIQETGGRKNEVLHPVAPGMVAEGKIGGELLRDAVRAKDVALAERTFAALARRSDKDAFNDLLFAVHDNTEVHRVVLPYRAWDLLDIVGHEHAHTMLRQSVRYCLKAEQGARNPVWDEPRTLLPRMLEKHGLLGRTPGTRVAEDAWVDALNTTLLKSTPEQAADAAGAALAEGFSPDAVGEAISLAANQLVLRDLGRPPQHETAGKPVGSVHGDSIGVHASDSANAWRNMARVSNARNTFACLILGAYQMALDHKQRGGDFLTREPLPVAWHVSRVTSTAPEALLRELDAAITGNLQAQASAVVHKYGSLGHSPRPVFDLLRRYATSEDGSLHAEKYYWTVSDEFARSRPAFAWRHLLALARVTASEYGRPAAGIAEARKLLGI